VIKFHVLTSAFRLIACLFSFLFPLPTVTMTANVKRLAEVWMFEKLQFSLYAVAD